MREIRVKHISGDTTAMLVEFYDDYKLLDWQEFNDTKDIQAKMSDFLFGEYKIVNG